MRGDGKNHHEKLGIKRIFCACQFAIPDTAGTIPDQAWNHSDTRSSESNRANGMADF